MTAEEVAALIHEMQGVCGECIVCAARTGCVDMFFPTGPGRACLVYVCDNHPHDPYTVAIVEQLIKMGVKSRWVFSL